MLRAASRWRKTGWKTVEFKQLRKGDVFKLYEPGTWDLVEGIEGHTTFTATSNPYTNRHGVLTIDTKDGS